MSEPRERGLYTQWTRHLPEDQKEAFAKEVKNSTRVLGRLADILEQEYSQLLETEDAEESLDVGVIAYSRGKRAQIRDLLRLLKFQDR